jgi:hypothetical protein
MRPGKFRSVGAAAATDPLLRVSTSDDPRH